MNTHTFYEALKAYLDASTTLISNSFKVYYSTTKVGDKKVLLNIDKFLSSDENSMFRIEMTIYATSTDYANLHSVMTSIRDSLDKKRNFLTGFKSSYAFCDGVIDDVVFQSVEGVDDRSVHAYFECVITVQT